MKFAFYSKESAFIITVNVRLSLQLRPWKAANAERGADYRRKQNCYYMDLELPKQHESHENDPGRKMTQVLKTENVPGFIF